MSRRDGARVDATHAGGRPRSLRHPLGALALGTALLLGPAQRAAGEGTSPPHLLLVTVDTLRADAVGCYGGHPTPNIDGLAARGVLFEDTMTTIGKTGPAFASLFTSLYPPTHGARRNGVPLRPDVPTLAELLRERGYQTAAFISNWTLRSRLSGLERGFDVYDETFNRKRNPVGAAERTADSVIEAAAAWLQGTAPDAPIFLWAHFSEPHDPYERHAGFDVPRPSQRLPGWQKRWRYGSEVRFVDDRIGALLEQVEPRLPAADRYTVFVADHGESLGEHGYWGHGKNTHWPNIRIPMILTGPQLPPNVRVRGPASIVDLLPTLAALLGLDAPDEIAGISLIGSWRTPLSESRTRYAFGDRHTAILRGARNRFQHPLEIALVRSRTKTIYDFDTRRPRYFDLVHDPLEHRPLQRPPIDTDPPLYRQLASWYRNLPKFETAGGELSEEDLEQLKALGYIGDP